VSAALSRAQLFDRGLKGGAALLVVGSATGFFAGSATADVITDGDLAYARLLVGAELLASDFYAKAIASKQVGGDALKYLKRAMFNEQEHYQAMAGILTGAGQTAASAADFDFSYPKGSFASKLSLAKLGVALETVFLGAYLGAVDGLLSTGFKQPVARIAASEADHLSVFTRLSGGNPVGTSFPDALSIDEASNALDAYTS
jgi:ferritin-like protein